MPESTHTVIEIPADFEGEIEVEIAPTETKPEPADVRSTQAEEHMKQTHFGDPCIHCGTPQMEVAPGACPGDPAKAKVIGYASLGVRPDGVEHFRYRLSTNEIREEHRHISEHAPYYHFGRKAELTNPPPYDARLRNQAA